jgi:hypothetical protein
MTLFIVPQSGFCVNIIILQLRMTPSLKKTIFDEKIMPKQRKGRKIGMIDEWSDLHPALLPFPKDFLPKPDIAIFHSGLPENNLQEFLRLFCRPGVTSDLRKRLFQRLENVIYVFDTDGKANEIRRQTTRFLLFFVQL